MALTTEQQTSHLSRLQQEVLTWDYYRMGGEEDAGASSGRTLREVPYTFASIRGVPRRLRAPGAGARAGAARPRRREGHPSEHDRCGVPQRASRGIPRRAVHPRRGSHVRVPRQDLILVSKTNQNRPLTSTTPTKTKATARTKTTKPTKPTKPKTARQTRTPRTPRRMMPRLRCSERRRPLTCQNMVRASLYLPEQPRRRSRATPRTRARSATKITRDFARCATRWRSRAGRGISCTSRTCPPSRREWLALHAKPGRVPRARHPQREAVQRPRALVLGTPGGAAQINARRIQRYAPENRTRARQGADPVAKAATLWA